MKDKLIQHWQNLQPRERKILWAGGGFLLLFLVYLFVETNTQRNLEMAQTLEKEQALLTWMGPVVAQISLTGTQKMGEPVTAQNILAQVEYSLSEAGLSAQIVTLNLVAQNEVRIEFNSIVYEALVGWLYAFSKQGVMVREFIATKTQEVGMVQASVLLSASN